MVIIRLVHDVILLVVHCLIDVCNCARLEASNETMIFFCVVKLSLYFSYTHVLVGVHLRFEMRHWKLNGCNARLLGFFIGIDGVPAGLYGGSEPVRQGRAV